MNGDVSLGGDGIISNALVEGNIIYGNGVGGGSGINCDGVQNSTIRNNLIYDTHASGISLYRIDGGGGSTGNVVVNNTVIVAADGRWALNIQSGSTGNTVRNNILYNNHSFRGAIDISADSLSGFTSDYNVLMNRMTTNGGTTRPDAGPVAGRAAATRIRSWRRPASFSSIRRATSTSRRPVLPPRRALRRLLPASIWKATPGPWGPRSISARYERDARAGRERPADRSVALQ